MTLAFNGKSQARRTWLLAAALLAVVAGIGGTLLLNRTDTRADTATITFDGAPVYSLGNINGQNGWSKTGPYDAAVVSIGGGQALRISNAVASTSLGDQTLSPSLINEAGETFAANGGLSGGARQSSFKVQWDVSSFVPGAQQPGLAVSLSPDRGDGGRMSFIRMQDDPGGITLAFSEFEAGPIPYTCDSGVFVETNVGTNLDRAVPHTVRLEMDFINGRGNDVVRVFVDGILKHTGTSWEDYFRDCESSPTKTVDQVLILARGTSVASVLNAGFLIDNLNMTTAQLPAPPTTTTVVEPNDLVTPPAPGWSFFDDNTDTVNNSLGSFVAGPGTPPLGQGSARVSTDADDRVFFNTTQFTGPLANLTELKYSTYTNAPVTPPFLNINVDFDLSGDWQNRLLFVPTGVIANTWQEHDAINAGAALWAYSGANWPAPNPAPGTTPKSWSQILTDYPNIRILPDNPQLGVRVGNPGPVQISHIDKFVFGTSLGVDWFDFEPTAPATATPTSPSGSPTAVPTGTTTTTPTPGPLTHKVFAIQVAGDSAPNGSQLLRDEASELLEGFFGGLLGARD